MSPTPILDLEQDPPRPRRQWAAMIVTVPISTAIFLAPFLAQELFPSAPSFNGLLWLPAIYVAIAIHELGHLVAGKLVGMEPGGLCIGGFLLIKSGRRWIFRFDFSQCFVGGFAKPLPPRDDFRRSHFVWMLAGGPTATILFIGLCALSIFTFGSGTWNWISTLFWGATLPLTSLIPFSSGGLMSDSALIWQLLKHPERSRRWISLLALQTQESNGALPRDWDPDLMRVMLDADEEGSYYAHIQMLAFYRHLDQRNTQVALQHLGKRSEGCFV